MPTTRPAKKALPSRMPPEPPELANMYGPPELSRPRGAGTTGAETEESYDFDTSAPVAPIAMEKLFSIDGVQYYIPAIFPPAYSVVYLDAVQRGRDVAAGEILKLATGAKGWDALVGLARERPDLIRPEQLNGIINRILEKAMGSLEENGEGN